MKDFFYDYQPTVGVLFYLMVFFSIFYFSNPIILLFNFLGSLIYIFVVFDRGEGVMLLTFTLSLSFICFFLYPIFNHEGVTILSYLGSGNPLTLESIAYSAARSLRIFVIIGYFATMTRVITSEKVLYITRPISRLSLGISFILRFAPIFLSKFFEIMEVQRCLGRRGIFPRLRRLVSSISALISYGAESMIIASDSMQGRGYGLKGRTSFTIFRWYRRDYASLFALLLILVALIYGIVNGGLTFRFYPMIKAAAPSMAGGITLLAGGVLAFFPVIINLLEVFKWKLYRSKSLASPILTRKAQL